MAHRIPCGSPHDNEREPIKAIERFLADEKWIIISNIGKDIPGLTDIDILLIGKKNIVCVELKKWSGKVATSQRGAWRVVGTQKTFTNPLSQAERAAFNLKTYLAASNVPERSFWVSRCVVLTADDSSIEYHHEIFKNLVFTLNEFPDGLKRHIYQLKNDTSHIQHGKKFIGDVLHALALEENDIKTAVAYWSDTIDCQSSLPDVLNQAPKAERIRYEANASLSQKEKPETPSLFPKAHPIKPSNQNQTNASSYSQQADLDNSAKRSQRSEIADLSSKSTVDRTERSQYSPIDIKKPYDVIPAQRFPVGIFPRRATAPVAIFILAAVTIASGWLLISKPSPLPVTNISINNSSVNVNSGTQTYHQINPSSIPFESAPKEVERPKLTLSPPKQKFIAGVELPPDPPAMPEAEFAVKRGQIDAPARNRFFSE